MKFLNSLSNKKSITLIVFFIIITTCLLLIIFLKNDDNKSTVITQDGVYEVATTSLESTSRKSEIQYYEGKPIGYADPKYSDIVGYDTDVGITMRIPNGIIPSIIKDGSLQEVVAYRFEDGLSGEYNDAFLVFSCFEAGVPKLDKAIPYVDFSQDRKVQTLRINNIDYYLMQYKDFFMLSDIRYVGPFNSNWDIIGCGSYMVGKELSEVHISFLQNIAYIESRDKFFKNIYNKFNQLYIK